MELFLMTQDAAKILGKSPETIRLYERSGKLPSIRTAGGRRLFREIDVRNLLAESTASSKEPSK